MRTEIDEILGYWFGELHEGFPLTDRSNLWWHSSESTDQEIRELFGQQVSAALAGQLDSWQETPQGRLALVILLDQFTRNIYRGSADAFAGDEKALALALAGIAAGQDKGLDPVHRLFFYMPLEHSEALKNQDLCLDCLEKLRAEVPQQAQLKIDAAIDFAQQHRDVIQRFGRFPHRNVVLGRESTAQELAHLNASHSRWGQ